jgi:hypothetical protein
LVGVCLVVVKAGVLSELLRAGRPTGSPLPPPLGLLLVIQHAAWVTDHNALSGKSIWPVLGLRTALLVELAHHCSTYSH